MRPFRQADVAFEQPLPNVLTFILYIRISDERHVADRGWYQL